MFLHGKNTIGGPRKS
jgi:hypothetical protein